MIKLNKIIFSFLFIILLSGCNKSIEYNFTDFINLIKSNKVKLINKTRALNGISYYALLTPPEYLVVSELNNDAKENDIRSLLFGYKNGVYCTFIIKDDDKHKVVSRSVANRDDYSKYVYLSNNGFEKLFVLTIDDTQYPCKLCHMEPISSINPEIRISLVFECTSDFLFNGKIKNCQITYNDELFNNGIVNISFDNYLINDWPKLKL